jgi:hypothetical protein
MFLGQADLIVLNGQFPKLIYIAILIKISYDIFHRTRKGKPKTNMETEKSHKFTSHSEEKY